MDITPAMITFVLLVSSLTGSYCLTVLQQNFVSSVINVARQYFTPGRTIVLTATRNNSKLANALMAQLSQEIICPLITITPGLILTDDSIEQLTKQERPLHYIIILNNTYEFELTIIKLLRNKYKNPILYGSVKIIMITTKVIFIAVQYIAKFMTTLKMHNTLILKPSSKSRGRIIDFYTWFPYQNKEQCSDFQDVVLIDKWLQDTGSFLNGTNLFPNKIPKYFGGCDIYTHSDNMNEIQKYSDLYATFTIKYQVDMLMEIFSRLDITMTFVPDNILADINMGYHSAQVYFEKNIYQLFSIPHLTTKLRWYIPCIKQNPRQGHISNVFHWSLWFLICLVIMLTVPVVCLTYPSVQQHERSSGYRSISGCFCNLWALMMGVSAPNEPRSNRLRLIFMLWIVYCFSISIVFQSFFTSFLVLPGFQKQLSTVEEIAQSGLGIILSEEGERLWCSRNDSISRICQNKIKVCKETKCLAEFFTWDNVSILTTELDVQILSNILGEGTEYCYIDDTSMQLDHAIGISFFTDFRYRINQFTQRMFENGLNNVIRQRSIQRYKFDTMKDGMFESIKHIFLKQIQTKQNEDRAETDSEYFSLRLTHLYEPMCSLGIGLALSFIVFVGEVIFRR